MLTKIAWVVGAIAVVAVMMAVALVPYLNAQLWPADPKPANVPDGAVPIPYVAKSRPWAKCWVEGTQTRCRIFNGSGQLLEDDVFVTFARGTSLATSDLAIVPERSGPDYLWLKNGEILLPKTNYTEHRRNVEKIIEKSQN